jgi:hypothetical protein
MSPVYRQNYIQDFPTETTSYLSYAPAKSFEWEVTQSSKDKEPPIRIFQAPVALRLLQSKEYSSPQFSQSPTPFFNGVDRPSRSHSYTERLWSLIQPAETFCISSARRSTTRNREKYSRLTWYQTNAGLRQGIPPISDLVLDFWG